MAIASRLNFRRALVQGWPVLLVLAAGVLLTFILARQAAEAELQIVESRFDQAARSRILLVEQLIDAQLRELDALRRFITLESELTRQEFEALTRLSGHVEMTMAWTENVSASHLDRYLDRMARYYDNQYRLRLPPSVEPLGGGDVPRHFPITYQKTSVPGADLVGMDTSHLPTRVKAYEQAMATGAAVLVAGIRTLDDPNDKTGILVFSPVFHQGEGVSAADRHYGSLRGFVALGLRLNDLAALVSEVHGNSAEIDLYFSEFISNGSGHSVGFPPPGGIPASLSFVREVEVADGAVTVVGLPRHPEDWAPRPTQWAVWLIGIVASGLAAAYLALLLVQRSRAVRMVRERTEELRQTNTFLFGILESAENVAIVSSDSHGTITLFNRGAERLLGYEADEVVGRQTPIVFHEPEELQVWSKQLTENAGRRVEGFDIFVACIEQGFERSQRWTYVRKDGERRIVQLTLSVMRDEGGEAAGYLGIAVDMTDYLRAVDALEDNNRLLQNLTANVPGAIYQYLMRPDGTSCFPYISDGVQRIFEVSPREANRSAKTALARVHPSDIEAVKRSVEKSRQGLVPWVIEFRVQLPEHGERWVRGESRPRRLNDGSTLWHGYISDVTEMKKLELQLREQATIDPLTGTFNRRHLETHWQREIARTQRKGVSFSLIMLDIDHFKHINDTYGHDMGDEALIRLGRMLRKDVRSTDVVYRLGGEEFLVLCEDTDLGGAHELAQMLLDRLRQLVMPSDLRVTASFSVIEVLADEGMPAAFKRLDALLYEAKANGRNQVMAAPMEPIA
ncbi:GGDEF domain-containing protein [Marinobacter nanhaiticus D15-8W]|uniref:diguanylate cyclase n=1 Tax=Marinobacter nanhaiticus D15-8W TaxID=626887 RepID=N6WVL4_9GAMM|nr:diguanylate cyclase [Marinobacter nanhaiticus]ENO15077.1 diguanylate cyclase [Marinobacter nanhaiticus D15-8W]BES69225.1 GGDEF domain-containing protein [Marinobacter nanhaiticus D15-8W]